VTYHLFFILFLYVALEIHSTEVSIYDKEIHVSIFLFCIDFPPRFQRSGGLRPRMNFSVNSQYKQWAQ
jgi:hypothetical protein